MNISIVGSNSFIAKNFYIFLKNKIKKNNVYLINKKTKDKDIKNYLKKSDKIYIFAGINRPKNKSHYNKNLEIVKKIIYLINRKKKIFFMSSSQINQPNVYGRSKKNCEDFLINLKKKNIIDLKIYRLPNVFGKWSKPNYNSVVATFCYNSIRNKPLRILKNKELELLYIDDLINLMFSDLKKKNDNKIICSKFRNTFKISTNKLRSLIIDIHCNYESKSIMNYNSKLIKYLYSTYLSFLPNKNYKYKVLGNKKKQSGFFLELFKSKFFGQISLLNIKNKSIRGMHYHNTKYEKFLVIHGKVIYTSKDLFSKKIYRTILSSSNLEIVHTIPGQIHYLQNLSKKPSSILVWANEIFNKNNQDTFAEKI
jgi:UDP-2-acetamido-2,6-beta-L-arabino-hexul-4-ose reductase